MKAFHVRPVRISATGSLRADGETMLRWYAVHNYSGQKGYGETPQAAIYDAARSTERFLIQGIINYPAY